MPQRKLSPLFASADIQTQFQQDEFENEPRMTGSVVGPLRPRVQTTASKLEAGLASQGINVQLIFEGGRKFTVVAKDYGTYLLAASWLKENFWIPTFKKFEIIKG